MGKMSEVYIEMLNNHYGGNLDEYLQMKIRESEVGKSEILCPNCLVDMLIQESQTDLNCIHCGFDFIKIDENTVKYK